MVLTLVTYIFHSLINYRLTDRIYCITTLPCKMLIKRRNTFYPSAAVAFHLFHKMCYVLTSRQEANNMNMVANASNTNNSTARGIDQLTDIAMHPFQMLVGYSWARSLHVEDDMKIDFAKRLWHICKAFALSGRRFVYYSISQGDALGYEIVGLSGRFSPSSSISPFISFGSKRSRASVRRRICSVIILILPK